MTKTNNLNRFLKELPTNIFSGLVVSLVALPLGLGLAMASDAPPIAGIIAAIVGGVVVSLLGGSFVTIAGPGNGLVGVLLIAIASLGLGNAFLAIVCSGVLLFLLGIARMGKLADFFPSSAIQGMLAAIGLIILGKQFHIMLGNRISKESAFDYLKEIPSTIIHLFNQDNKAILYAALTGIISLAIMLFFGKMRNKYLKLIPAPMWIVMIWIGFSYYFEWVRQAPNPIHTDYMIKGIPDIPSILNNLPQWDYQVLRDFAFWGHVLALTLIAGIESLLSIKAVDKLDPQKRRSNVNKDLKALGLATIGSGFMGGLNVVTVIARSSVNVNNGGSNRSSNFSHALFLLLFIMLFSTQLTRIPLPALMSILVYTGYMLASPKVIRKIFSIGKEQIAIFFVTLIVTLKVGLISGILAGVFITFLIHIWINKNLKLFLREFLKPNVLMYKENETGNFYISVKHFCTFLNYYKLKDKIDAVPENNHLIVDFSLCKFVDHSAMENMSNYRKIFENNGGHFEITGLDMHHAQSGHPFALRKIWGGVNNKSNKTRRQLRLEELAKDYQLKFSLHKNENPKQLKHFRYFKTKNINYTFNHLSENDGNFALFDVEFSEGEFIAKELVRSTMMHISLNKVVPEFVLDKEGFLEKLSNLVGQRDINLKGHSDFSKRFHLMGEKPDSIKAFFNEDMIHFFESNAYFHIESKGDSLLIFNKERLAGLMEIKKLLDFGKRLHVIIENDLK